MVGVNWVLVVVAVVAEVTGTLALRASAGFSRLWPSVVVVVGYGVAFFLLARVIEALGVGPVYAAWAGLGTVGAALGGWLIFSERITAATAAGMLLVIAGVVVMSVFGEVRPG